MNTVEKTSTEVTPADLILSHSIRLTSHIMSPVSSSIDSSNISISDRMDEWISRQRHRSNKLLSKHREPYQVRGRKQSIHIIKDLVLAKQIKTHVHNLLLTCHLDQCVLSWYQLVHTIRQSDLTRRFVLSCMCNTLGDISICFDRLIDCVFSTVFIIPARMTICRGPVSQTG